MKKCRRIILFYPAYEQGGATKVLVNLVNFFLKKKNFVELLSLNAEYKNFKKSRYLNIANISKNRQKKLGRNRIYYNFFSITKLIKLLTQNNNKDTVLFSMQSHLISSIIGKIFFYKVIIRNSEDPFGATKYAENKFFSILVFISKFISFNLANKIITNATKSFNSIRFFLIKKSKVKIILNPYIKENVPKFVLKKQVRKKYFLAIGRFAKQKNFEFLVEVFFEISKKLQNYKLILIGSGSEKNKIIRKIDSLDLKKKIIVKNWSKNLSKDLRSSKIFILPSLYEGCPNILIDAISNEIPCISSACSGSDDVLRNNKAGLIYPVNDKEKLIKSVFRIIKNYKNFQRSAIKFSISRKRFYINNQAEKYLKFLIN